MSCGSYYNDECGGNCSGCPTTSCQFVSIHNQNAKRINKQVRMSGSLQIFKRKAAAVSRIVGQSAHPGHLSQAGGPGDLISAVERRGRKPVGGPSIQPQELRKVTYNMGSLRNRLAPTGKSGVDKKHGSYARFLARKTGGVLRKEQMPQVKKRKASIHQPRNRTGTKVTCRQHTTTTTKQYFPLGRYQDVNGTNFSQCDSSNCCINRIPQVKPIAGSSRCYQLKSNYANKWNSGNKKITGACGNPGNCVATSCRCCSK